MKPHLHAESSAKKFGGKADDYLPIHDAMDSSKAHVADVRHRALFHHSFGCFVMERIFGTTITNSAGKRVSVRDVAEQHILEDLGFIPSVHEYLSVMQIGTWMGGPTKREPIATTLQEVLGPTPSPLIPPLVMRPIAPDPFDGRTQVYD